MPGVTQQPGLTPKQAKFTQEVIRQIQEEGQPNLTQAALKTYDTTDYKTASNIASENMDNPRIKKTLQEAFDLISLTPTVIAKNFKFVANSRPDKISADAMLKANIEVAKLMGAYPTQKTAHLSLSVKANLNDMKYEDVKQELDVIDGELKALMDETEAKLEPSVAEE